MNTPVKTTERTLFCIQPEFADTRESMAVIKGCRALGWDYCCRRECPPDAIPVGSVEFCEQSLPAETAPIDFFPEFLRGHLHREVVGPRLIREPLPEPRFVKLATAWKSRAFPSQVVAAGEWVPTDILFYSAEPVRFVQEWRYYVSDRAVLATGWYDGLDEEEPAPPLPRIDWPNGYCGAVDFGRLSTGQLALVEAHAPFAAGWYGDDHSAYTMWLAEGWRYLQKNASIFRLHVPA